MNHFEWLGQPVAFRLDESALRAAYYRKSKQYHPDFHTLADEAAQAEVLELSTRTNQAYATLSDPDARMRYVLELQGLLGDESERTALPNDFLMDMMEINEAIMDLEMDFDASTHERTLQQVQALENELLAQVQPTLDTWHAESGQPEELLPVRDFFLKKRYLLRVKENLSKFAPA
jgi:molecular chaperone HscB